MNQHNFEMICKFVLAIHCTSNWWSNLQIGFHKKYYNTFNSPPLLGTILFYLDSCWQATLSWFENTPSNLCFTVLFHVTLKLKRFVFLQKLYICKGLYIMHASPFIEIMFHAICNPAACSFSHEKRPKSLEYSAMLG